MSLSKNLMLAALTAMSSLCALGTAEAAPKHIFYIMMENHSYDEIIGNTTDAPFINQLAAHGAVATNYYGVTHPSLPNYLAAISGDFQGIWDDCKAGAAIVCPPEEFVPGSGDGTDGNYLTPQEITSASNTPHWFGGKTLVDQLESRNMTWKGYFQSMPAGAYNDEYDPIIGGTTVKLYAQKHNPFVYFANIRNSPQRLANIVPFENNFAADLASGNVPNFVFIAPDQCHDMHGISAATAALINLPSCAVDSGAIQLGDAWLKDTVTAIKNSKVWKGGDSAIIIVWDEDDYAGFAGCCGSPTGVGGITLGGASAPLIVLTSNGPQKPKVVKTPANHYTLLGTIQNLWHLGCLANTCEIPTKNLLTNMFQGN